MQMVPYKNLFTRGELVKHTLIFFSLIIIIVIIVTSTIIVVKVSHQEN